MFDIFSCLFTVKEIFWIPFPLPSTGKRTNRVLMQPSDMQSVYQEEEEEEEEEERLVSYNFTIMFRVTILAVEMYVNIVCHGKSGIQEKEESLLEQIGRRFKEEINKV